MIFCVTTARKSVTTLAQIVEMYSGYLASGDPGRGGIIYIFQRSKCYNRLNSLFDFKRQNLALLQRAAERI